MTNCIHVVKGVGDVSQQDFELLVTKPSCDVCRLSGEKTNIWLCLYPDCYMRGCTNIREGETEDHSTQHNLEYPGHCLQLNMSSWRAWCYKCQAEVFLTKNKPVVRGAFGKKRSSSGTASSNIDKYLGEFSSTSSAGLVGLSNLGNTCFMNAALQCLSNIPVLRNHLIHCPDLIPRDIKPNLSFAFRNLMVKMWDPSSPNYVEPLSVLTAMKTVFPAFRGFQQHDSQEFLRCFLDQLHKELSEPIQQEDEELDETKTESSSDNIESLSEVESNGSGTGPEDHGDDYETASDNSERIRGAGSKKRKHDDDKDEDSGLGSYAGGAISSHRMSESETTSSRVPGSPSSLSDQEYLDATSDPGSGSQSPIVSINPDQLEIRNHKPRIYRSIVTEVFDGKLVSSLKCLSCDRVSKTMETFQDLSLPIPSQDALSNISERASGMSGEGSDGWISWMWRWFSSWFYGPDVTLQDCLAFFFSEDELKGDNMYSCERCKKLRNGLKYSKVTQLPETLCIHLKRFRHDFAFSSKISTRVTFPLTGLDLGPWLHKDCVSSQVLYDLVGVICHHGTAGGGHYTSYAYNSLNGNWYHYDDSIVSEVDPATVSNAEAYVLFYKKNGDELDDIRNEVKLAMKETSQSLVNNYISLPWWVKFNDMAEPGQIDNSSVLCQHGAILPRRIHSAQRLSILVTPAAWKLLHERFGNSASALTNFKPCQTCVRSLRMEERQKQFERNEFQLLHDQELSGEEGDSFLLVRSWYTAWEEWVMDKAREPPGPINNRNLYTQRGNSYQLRPNVDRLKINEDIWTFFLSLYSGGPEVVQRPGGGIKVSTPRLVRIQSIAARLQARCRETVRLSESSFQNGIE